MQDPAERPAAAQLVRTLEKISGILNKVDTVTRAADAAQSPVEAGAEGSREFPVKAAQPPPQEWEDELDELEALICAPPSGELGTPPRGCALHAMALLNCCVAERGHVMACCASGATPCTLSARAVFFIARCS